MDETNPCPADGLRIPLVQIFYASRLQPNFFKPCAPACLGLQQTFSTLLWLSSSTGDASFLPFLCFQIYNGHLLYSFCSLQTAYWKTNEAIAEAELVDDTHL